MTTSREPGAGSCHIQFTYAHSALSYICIIYLYALICSEIEINDCHVLRYARRQGSSESCFGFWHLVYRGSSAWLVGWLTRMQQEIVN
jgi:hypothetical protein